MVFDIDGSNGKIIVPKGAYGWELQAHAKWSPDGTKYWEAPNVLILR